MPETLPALGIGVLALLPGALYVWAFERQVGRWGIGLSDRVLRFFGGSAAFHALCFPLTVWLVTQRWPETRSSDGIDWVLWIAALGYVGLPAALGSLVGRGRRREWRWTRLFTGPNDPPRAWDHLFGGDLDGWVRLRLKSGTWLAGAHANANGRRSYAAGYPEPQDLFLAASVAVDPITGEFLTDGEDVVTGPGGLLVRWDEVEYLEFIDA